MEKHRVSICIPTCNRLAFLKEAIDSCLSQRLLPYEIIIGDDSENKDTEHFVNSINIKSSVNIKYQHNQPPLGQAENVNSIFDRVQGDKIVLLHDDDLLMPDALKLLSKCFKRNPTITAAFGKQYIISSKGEIDFTSSEGLNKSYFRISENEGTKILPFNSGLLQQFPNDCYMVDALAAKNIRYRNKKEVGNACDFDFGFRLGKASEKFYFINRYTAKYRLSESSIGRGGIDDAAYFSYKIVEESQNFPKESLVLKDNFLKKNIHSAIIQAALNDKKKSAIRLFFKNFFMLFSPPLKGIKLFIFIIIYSMLSSRAFIKLGTSFK